MPLSPSKRNDMTEPSSAAKRAMARIGARNKGPQPLPEKIQTTTTAIKKPLIPVPTKRDFTKVRALCIEIINEIDSDLKSDTTMKKVPTSASEISPLLILSDLHFGEHIVKNGEEIFNFDIATKQLNSIVEKSCSAMELQGWFKEQHYSEFNILLAGDIIDGELIYPAQAYETDGDAYSQFQRVAKVLWKSFLTALDYGYSSVNVFCVAGNHGRMSKIHSQMSNWDNALYYMLAMMAEVSPLPIKVTVPKHMWLNFKIRNTNVHTRHIGVTQANSASPGRKLLNWMIEHDADIIAFGHYHNAEMFSVNGCRIFKNGSLPPINDYAENLGFADGRGQWFLGISDNGLEFSKIVQADYE
jgi:predicted phosphodiesterase